LINGSQQPFMTRNSDLDGWTNSVWNQVFCGTNGAPPQDFVMGGNQYTTLATCPVTEEEPFLYTDSQGNYNVFVPAVRQNSAGPSWASGTAAGTSVPLSKFFVASPGMSGAAITAALAQGKDLILSPGVYDLNQPIVVPHPDTVVLGLGMATLVPQHGNAAMVVVRNTGVKVSGLIIDAGPVKSPVLVSVGTPGPSSASDPDLIQDVFFRIGGAATTPVSATVSLLDNAGNSIIDDDRVPGVVEQADGGRDGRGRGAADAEEDVLDEVGVAGATGSGRPDRDQDRRFDRAGVDDQTGHLDPGVPHHDHGGVAMLRNQGGHAQAQHDGVGVGDHDGLVQVIDARGQDEILALGQRSGDGGARHAWASHEELRQRDGRAGCRAARPGRASGILPDRGDEDVVIALRVGVEER